MKNPDEVDYMVGALDRPVDRPAVADIGLDGMHLAHIAEGEHMHSLVRVAAGHPNAISSSRQCQDHIAADEAGAAEYCDELGVLADGGHECLGFGLPSARFLIRFPAEGKGRERSFPVPSSMRARNLEKCVEMPIS